MRVHSAWQMAYRTCVSACMQLARVSSTSPSTRIEIHRAPAQTRAYREAISVNSCGE